MNMVQKRMEITDQYLLQLLRTKHTVEQGFRLLMQQYRKPIYWHIRRLVVSEEDAQDLLQETFINVFRYIHNFSEQSTLKTWIFKIATNECIRLYNKKKIETASIDSSHFLIEILKDEHTINYQEMEVQFQKAILLLPEKQRIAFTLRYYDELKYEEIAEITGQRTGTLKTAYHYAQEKIRNYMLNL